MNLSLENPRRVGIIAMGTSGSGKSTIAKEISLKLGCKLIEGDDFHSQYNIEKMKRGEGLTDKDREPWLNTIASEITQHFTKNPEDQVVLITCSALKLKYRKLLNSCETSNLKLGYLYLKGDVNIIKERLKSRPGHFAKSNLLDSQLRDLEVPSEPEIFEVVSINTTLEDSIKNGYTACQQLINRLAGQ
jgi:gluconokinase